MQLNRFYVFGDSICFGQLVNPHKTWVYQISKKLDFISTHKNKFLLQNLSVNGNTTRQALERLSFDVLVHRPDYVLIQFGLNDCNYWETDFGSRRVSPEAFKANLEDIIGKVLNSGTKYCFLNTNHPTDKGNLGNNKTKIFEDSARYYNEIIREVYNQFLDSGVPIVLFDVEKHISKLIDLNPSKGIRCYLLDDGIHLNEEGHKVYADFIVPQLLKTLPV